MEDVTITGMNRVTSPKPNAAGRIILAYFDCTIPRFSMRGCAFIRTERGGLTVSMPKLNGPENDRRSVLLTCEHTRKAMVNACRVTYRALGGTDGDYVPSVDGVPAHLLPGRAPTDWGTDLEIGGIMHAPPARGYVPSKKGDIGYDGFPLDRDLSDEEAASGLARYLGEAE